MKIRVDRRFGRSYEAVLEDEHGFSVFGASSGPCSTAKEARKALEDMIVQTMRDTGKDIYVFVEADHGLTVFHLHSVRGRWVYALVSPGRSAPALTIFGERTQTQEQALQAMIGYAQQYGTIVGVCPDYYRDLLEQKKASAV